MKRLILFIITIALILGCSVDKASFSEYYPAIEIEMIDTLRFVIPTGDNEVWDYEDRDSTDIDLIISEENGLDAFITSISWRIEDYNGTNREHDDYIPLRPIELKGNKSDTLTIPIYLNGHDAQDIDENDGNEDSVGRGIITFEMTFYDDNGYTSSTRKFYAYIIAVKQ